MSDTIDMDSFAARHAEGASVIDVREASEYVAGHVPGARFVPMSRISLYLADLPRDRDVHVICASGNRSSSMADLLRNMGVRAISVQGGTNAWVAGGRPVVTGTSER